MNCPHGYDGEQEVSVDKDERSSCCGFRDRRRGAEGGVRRVSEKMVSAWFIVTPAGEAGPYFLQQAAREEAKKFGYKVVRREVPFVESSVLQREARRSREDW